MILGLVQQFLREPFRETPVGVDSDEVLLREELLDAQVHRCGLNPCWVRDPSDRLVVPCHVIEDFDRAVRAAAVDHEDPTVNGPRFVGQVIDRFSNDRGFV